MKCIGGPLDGDSLNSKKKIVTLKSVSLKTEIYYVLSGITYFFAGDTIDGAKRLYSERKKYGSNERPETDNGN